MKLFAFAKALLLLSRYLRRLADAAEEQNRLYKLHLEHLGLHPSQVRTASTPSTHDETILSYTSSEPAKAREGEQAEAEADWDTPEYRLEQYRKSGRDFYSN